RRREGRDRAWTRGLPPDSRPRGYSRPASLARAPALSARALATCPQRDQLPAIFRPQHTGPAVGGRTPPPPFHSWTCPPPRCRGLFARAAARSHRWAARSAPVFPPAAAAHRRRTALKEHTVLRGGGKDSGRWRAPPSLCWSCRHDRL